MRSTQLILASIAALGGAVLTGCPDDTNNTTDAYVTPTDDANVPSTDDAAVPATPVIATGERSAPEPADITCVGTNTAPSAGAGVAGTVTFTALGVPSAFPVANGAVQVFPGAVVRAACDGDCVSGTTSATGTLDATLPSGGWFGYRMAAAGTGSSSSVPVVGQFYTWGSEPSGNVTVTAISSTVAEIIAGQLNRTLEATTSAVSGSVRDCDGAEIANVRVRFYRGDTEIVSGSNSDTTTPRITGLGDGAVPSPNASGLTGYLGRFAGVVPAAGGTIRVEAWGVTTEGGEAELIGCEEVLVEGSTITVAVIPALRSDADYGAGHSCVGRGT